jgi:taurine dioxygenase
MWGMSNHQAAQLPDGNGKMALAEFGDSPLVRHPMVLTHPESGLKSLLLYPLGYLRVLGLDQGEGDALYDQIVGHALQDKYCYRHHWRPHDMVLWDNRRTMHMAFGYPYEMKRHGFRTTLKNDFRVGRYDET